MFVAGFIGSPGMSFARCDARRNSDSIELRSGTLELALPANGEVPSDVVVGIRPEHARLWESEAGLLGPLEGQVEFEEAIGRETLLGLAVDTGVHIVLVAEGLARTPIGSRVRFGVKPGSIYLFDPETERFLTRG
jgi:ABC-type sugar transport system ATPase subunit